MTGQLDIFKQGLTDEEFRVWEVVQRHRDPQNAVKVDTVAWRTGLEGQRVREVVSDLVNKHGKLIGSRTGKPAGYYIITSKEELEEHVRSLRHRGIMCLVRAAALSRQSIEDIFKQGRFEVDGM